MFFLREFTPVVELTTRWRGAVSQMGCGNWQMCSPAGSECINGWRIFHRLLSAQAELGQRPNSTDCMTCSGLGIGLWCQCGWLNRINSWPDPNLSVVIGWRVSAFGCWLAVSITWFLVSVFVSSGCCLTTPTKRCQGHFSTSRERRGSTAPTLMPGPQLAPASQMISLPFCSSHPNGFGCFHVLPHTLLLFTVVERQSLAGEVSLPHARLAADGWPLLCVNHLLQVSQPGQLSFSSFLGW